MGASPSSVLPLASPSKAKARIAAARHYKRTVIAIRRLLPDAQGAVGYSLEACGRVHCVARKRPLKEFEARKNAYDVVSCRNPVVVVHDCSVAGVALGSKFVQNTVYPLDAVYDETARNSELYQNSVAHVANKCVYSGQPGTVFLVGGRNSGKSFTLDGLLGIAGPDVFRMFNVFKLHRGHELTVSALQITPRDTAKDLLNSMTTVSVRNASGKGFVFPSEATHVVVTSRDQVVAVLKRAAAAHKHSNANFHAVYRLAIRRKPPTNCFPCLKSKSVAVASPHVLYSHFTIVQLAPWQEIVEGGVGDESPSMAGMSTPASVRPLTPRNAEAINRSLANVHAALQARAASESPEGTARPPAPALSSAIAGILPEAFITDGFGSLVTVIATVSPLPNATEASNTALRAACAINCAKRGVESDTAITTERVNVSEHHSPSTRDIMVAEERKVEHEVKALRSPMEWSEPEVTGWIRDMCQAKPSLKAHQGAFVGLMGRELCTLSKAQFVSRCGGDEALGAGLLAAISAIQEEAGKGLTPVHRTSSRQLIAASGSSRQLLAASGSPSGSPRASPIHVEVPSPSPKRATARPPQAVVILEDFDDDDE